MILTSKCSLTEIPPTGGRTLLKIRRASWRPDWQGLWGRKTTYNTEHEHSFTQLTEVLVFVQIQTMKQRKTWTWLHILLVKANWKWLDRCKNIKKETKYVEVEGNATSQQYQSTSENAGEFCPNRNINFLSRHMSGWGWRCRLTNIGFYPLHTYPYMLHKRNQEL